MQKQKISPEISVNTEQEALSAKFEEIKNRPTKRIVNLIYKSVCGCGFSDVTIKREVEFDSPLQNGDRITEILENDDVV